MKEKLVEQLTALNDLRLENKIDRNSYAVQLSEILNLADKLGVSLFDTAVN